MLHAQVNGWKVVTTTNMAIIFFIFGLTTDTSELLLALKAWKAIAFGLASILVLSPLFGFLCMLLPFKPYEFSLGLAVMACVPTSLSSGVTLVIGSYGNGALALLFTVSSNILGIVTSPLAVKAVLGSRTDTKVDSGDLLVKLGVSILMPVLVGKGLREAVRPLRETVPKIKAPLYLINNLQARGAVRRAGVVHGRFARASAARHACGSVAGTRRASPRPALHVSHVLCACVPRPHQRQITMIVWQKLSSAREVLVEQEAGDVLLAGAAAPASRFGLQLLDGGGPCPSCTCHWQQRVVALHTLALCQGHLHVSGARVCLLRDTCACVPLCAGFAAIVLHFAFLFFNMLVTWLLRFPEKERKAMIVMASQKNLPTAAGALAVCARVRWGGGGACFLPAQALGLADTVPVCCVCPGHAVLHRSCPVLHSACMHTQ
jgi:predicted Na+-dependent transporter